MLNLNFPPKKEFNGTNDIGIESIKLVTGGDSYNYVKRDFKQIFVVGQGQKSSPGHPSNHQSELNQRMVSKSFMNNNQIHIIHEVRPGKMIYRGVYRITAQKRKISAAGWVYKEIELRRD